MAGKLTDRNYFQHFYGARNELAILKLRSVHGQAGYGAYWEIIEKLFENGGEMNLKDISLFAFELHIDNEGVKVLESVIKDFGLFEINETTGDFTAQTVVEQLQFRAEQSEKARKKAAARWGNTDKEDNAKVNEESTMQGLSFIESEVIINLYFRGYSICKTVQILGKSSAAVRSAESRAVKAMSEYE